MFQMETLLYWAKMTTMIIANHDAAAEGDNNEDEEDMKKRRRQICPLLLEFELSKRSLSILVIAVCCILLDNVYVVAVAVVSA